MERNGGVINLWIVRVPTSNFFVLCGKVITFLTFLWSLSVVAYERSEAAKHIPVIIERFCPSMYADLCPVPLTRTGLWVYLTSPVQGFVGIFDFTNFLRPFLYVLRSLVRSHTGSPSLYCETCKTKAL